MNWIRVILIQIIVGLLLLEFFSFVGTKLELFLVNDRPTFYRDFGFAGLDVHDARTEKENWGVWRLPNTKSRQSSSCFDIEIATNEIGARDESFRDNNASDIVLLGDSFTEGLGVEYEDTAQYQIEQNTGLNVLNFGISGDFGPLQQLIIYKELAKKYEHKQVIVFVLPANDFIDNERSNWIESPTKRIRYRPYFGSDQEPLTPWYFPEATPTDTFGSYRNVTVKGQLSQITDIAKNFIIRYLWLSNPLRSFYYVKHNRDFTKGSYYISASDNLSNNLVEAYKAIAREADGRPVSFVIIPTERDIKLLGPDTLPIVKSKDWYVELKHISATSGGFFIDLLDHVPDDSNRLFHKCDGHWSAYGNQLAALLITDLLGGQILD